MEDGIAKISLQEGSATLGTEGIEGGQQLSKSAMKKLAAAQEKERRKAETQARLEAERQANQTDVRLIMLEAPCIFLCDPRILPRAITVSCQ